MHRTVNFLPANLRKWHLAAPTELLRQAKTETVKLYDQ